jgi:hypothetical protein
VSELVGCQQERKKSAAVGLDTVRSREPLLLDSAVTG